MSEFQGAMYTWLVKSYLRDARVFGAKLREGLGVEEKGKLQSLRII